jgi:hypothetical protein
MKTAIFTKKGESLGDAVLKLTAKEKAKSNRPRRVSKKMRLEDLRLLVDACFTRLDEDMKEVANQTGLCLSTLYRLQSDRLTLHIEVGTLDALIRAAGLSMTTTDSEVRVILVD